jgi:regulator of protease activity HflC (stomatin/prohibitin superfamily)
MSNIQTIFLAALATMFGLQIAVPVVLGLLRLLGTYAIVEERQAKVYTLFGKVLGVLDEPGLHLLWKDLGVKALLVNWLGSCQNVDLRLDQEYLRSLPVNSEEGAPMGLGMWYEFWVSDPVSFLFKNTDPRGSLRANVSSATVRCLSNMKLEAMLETRHDMSQTVRDEVTPKSHEWGYKLGSVYIRKVHFRDIGMIKQIEEKVVNRLRQVTSAIRQDGTNQVNIIKSTAEREAAVAFAKAASMRPFIVGKALQTISEDPEVFNVLFDVLETQKVIESDAALTLLPLGEGQQMMAQMLATRFNAPATLPAKK